MPYSEFLECWAYEQLEPFGEKGDYLRAGTHSALLANIHRDPKKRSEPYVPQNFIPDVDAEQKAAEELHRRFAAFVNMHNEKVKRQQIANA